MRVKGIRLILVILGIAVPALAVGVILDPVHVAAQAGEKTTQPPNQDMWNPFWMQRDMWSHRHMGPGMQQRMQRHWTFMHFGTPPDYRGARNTLPSDAKTIGEGRTLYQANCASCHGPRGAGDGDQAKALNPSPALLAYLIQTPMAVDEYMLWTISEGGQAFGTGMPVFMGTLARDDIWKVITYMRAGFPAP
jgi:mono/diheme cytochrome c family protein